MNTKSKKILLTLGLIVMCLAVISTVSAAHQYTDAECKEIAQDYVDSHLEGYTGVTQISSSSSEVTFMTYGHYGTCQFSVNRDSGLVHRIGGGGNVPNHDDNFMNDTSIL